MQGPVSMTAISRPVSRGVLPAVLKLSGENEGRKQFGRAELTIAIERLARMTMAETAAHLGGLSAHMAWLLSDMLLVEGLLQATGADTLTVAEIDLTNIPGLLADERAFAWQRHYGCYLIACAAWASMPMPVTRQVAREHHEIPASTAGICRECPPPSGLA